jgi:hypothetical protein
MEWNEFYTSLLHTKGFSRSAYHEKEINEPSICDVPVDLDTTYRKKRRLQALETLFNSDTQLPSRHFSGQFVNSFAQRLVMTEQKRQSVFHWDSRYFQFLIHDLTHLIDLILVFLTCRCIAGNWDVSDGITILHSRPGRFIPWDRLQCTNSIGGWTNPNVGLHAVYREIFCPYRESNTLRRLSNF